MEKDIKLGSIGDVDLKFSSGVATISLNIAVPGNVGVSGGASIQISSALLLDKLFAAIEAKLPAAGIPIEESVKNIIKEAVAAIQ